LGVIYIDSKYVFVQDFECLYLKRWEVNLLNIKGTQFEASAASNQKRLDNAFNWKYNSDV
jgi:hypothetical protein